MLAARVTYTHTHICVHMDTERERKQGEMESILPRQPKAGAMMEPVGGQFDSAVPPERAARGAAAQTSRNTERGERRSAERLGVRGQLAQPPFPVTHRGCDCHEKTRRHTDTTFQRSRRAD